MRSNIFLRKIFLNFIQIWIQFKKNSFGIILKMGKSSSIDFTRTVSITKRVIDCARQESITGREGGGGSFK